MASHTAVLFFKNPPIHTVADLFAVMPFAYHTQARIEFQKMFWKITLPQQIAVTAIMDARFFFVVVFAAHQIPAADAVQFADRARKVLEPDVDQYARRER